MNKTYLPTTVTRLPAAILAVIVGISAGSAIHAEETPRGVGDPSALSTQSSVLSPQSSVPNPQSTKGCLAGDCHAAVAEPKYLHGPVAVNDCEPCHQQTDAENHKYRMVAEPPELCFACHVKFRARLGDPAVRPHHHPPVDAGECLACHTPHAAPRASLLVEAYAAEMYLPYEEGEGYALCFQCHDSELTEEQETDEYTKFRDGKKNLHHLHVVKPSKGTSCRACHLPHAADHPRLIRGKVSVQEKKLPMQYKPTDTGGSCGPTCHPATRYDRATPVDQGVRGAALRGRHGGQGRPPHRRPMLPVVSTLTAH